MLKRSNLYNYQKKAIEFIKDKKKCALFLDMGLGKTVSSLTAVNDMLDDFEVNKILIIAPLKVANKVWLQESKRWEHLQHLNISICTGNTQQRIEALNTNSDIHIINRENVTWLYENVTWKWDMLIIDESSSFKSFKSKRFKTLKRIIKNVKSIVLLTGTPIPNGMMDMWTQMYLIDNGKRLGRTISNYRQRFFNKDYMGFKYELKEGAYDEIKSVISDVCLSMKAKDYVELPDCVYLDEYIDLPTETRKQYDELEKEFLLTLENKVDIVSETSAVLANKLLQFCNGSIYDQDGNYHIIHDFKIEELKNIIEESSENDNFLIAYNFKSDLERLQKALPKAITLSREADELDEWNKGNIKILLAHPASAGHGLNAQFGGSIVVWFGLNWSLELYQQFNARLHRQGQTKPVRIIHLAIENSIDKKVLEALKNKASTQNDLLKYLKNSK